MPTFEITLPDGRTVDVDGPDAETAAKGAVQWAKSNPAAKRSSRVGDVVKSGATGIARAATSLGGAKGDFIDSAANALIGGARDIGLINERQAGNALSAVTNARRSGAVGGVFSPMFVSPTTQELRQGFGVNYRPQTSAGGYAMAIGENSVNALMPGGATQRIANVVLPAVGGEAASQSARAMGAGEGGQALARAAGSVAGGALASVQPRALNTRAPENALQVRAPQDPAALRQRAQEYRDVGIDPTLVDVMDESGRGIVRASASRMTPAREAAQNFRDARALNLPDRISGQARAAMSQDPRTPDQIRQAMEAQRSANAGRAFGAVRNDPIQLDTDTLATFRVPEVADAVADAARRERDPVVRGELARLAQWAQSGTAPAQAPQITVGMADRISRVLLGKAQGTQDRDLAATLRSLGNAIRDPARQASPGYAQALQQFGDDSRLAEAAGIGEQFMTRNTDEFVAATQGMDQGARELALAAGRRAIERQAGENISAAPGVARKIADAPEQQARNVALLGPQGADRLQRGMRLEERALRNANDIAPRTGSQTQLRQQDAGTIAADVMAAGQRIARQDYVGLAMDWMRSRGISDQQAQALVEASIDPQRLDGVIAAIENAYGPGAARGLIDLRNAALIGSVSAAGAQEP